MKFRKKPVVIEAVQWTGNNLTDVIVLGCGNELEQELCSDKLVIKTLEGDMTADNGDWIIKGVKGEFYPIKNDIFLQTYERVE